MDFEFIYKICTKAEWLKAKKEGKFSGSKKDIEDGFIHFSNKDQLKGTLSKYFFSLLKPIENFFLINEKAV